MYDQAIGNIRWPVYYTYATEYDRKMEEAYTAKAHALIVTVYPLLQE